MNTQILLNYYKVISINMTQIINQFFSNIEFNFEHDFQEHNELIENCKELKETFNVYYYNTKDLSNNFYILIAKPNYNQELFKIIHNRIWEENKIQIYFLCNDSNIDLNYAASYYDQNIQIDSYEYSENNILKLEKIKKSKFDTNLFWAEYYEIIKKKKISKVDKVLLESILYFREKLEDKISFSDLTNVKKSEIVQAIIERILFIKFLEDRHILNSDFFKYNFNNISSFKELLQKCNSKQLNQLFSAVNNLTNNNLFIDPKIDEKYLSAQVISLIYNTITGVDKKGQLRLPLGDFMFDVLPVELIGNIYEAFLDKEQRKNGIYYTPPDLAEYIIKKIFNYNNKNISPILDPTCGSGIFLVSAYKKFINQFEKSNNFKSIKKQIDTRKKIMSDNIFGIEINPVAARLTKFSLYLEMLNGIDNNKLNKFLKTTHFNKNLNIFPDLSNNIVNTSIFYNEINKVNSTPQIFNKKFTYIIGNPPWLKINKNNMPDEHKLSFEKKYKDTVSGKQFSQMVLVKIYDWIQLNSSKETTYCGFIVNSSNFYDETAIIHRKFLLEKYRFLNIIELTEVKHLLFENAKEPCVVLLFDSNKEKKDNLIIFNKVKQLKLNDIIKQGFINQSDNITVNQKQLINNDNLWKISLNSSKYDYNIIKKINRNAVFFSEYIKDELKVKNSSKKFVIRGLEFFDRNKNYNLFQALLNSSIIQYFFIIYSVKRYKTSFSRVNAGDYLNLPMPDLSIISKSKYFTNIINDIIKLSEIVTTHFVYENEKQNIIIDKLKDLNKKKWIDKFSNSKNVFNEIYEYIDELIFDLYEMNILEINYIKDVLKYKNSLKNISKLMLENYAKSFIEVLKNVFDDNLYIDFEIEENVLSIFSAVKICFKNKSSNTVNLKEIAKFNAIELLQKINTNIFANPNVMFSDKNAIYIFRDRSERNWTESQAVFDAQNFADKIIKKHRNKNK